jgi:transposase-like protein
MRVIDGMHRLSAARIRGQQVIDVRLFDGDEMSAFVLAVRTNVIHGLPLSLADRKSAATRILGGCPHWSDRTVALVSGLAPQTVARLRERLTVQDGQLNTRLGRDGRIRPVNGAERRALAAALMREEPSSSLRDIARRAGISPETVRRVRVELNANRSSADPEVEVGVTPAVLLSSRHAQPLDSHNQVPSLTSVLKSLAADPSIRLSDMGRVVLRALTVSVLVQNQSAQLTKALPEHALVSIALAARGCAHIWQQLGRQVEHRMDRQYADHGAVESIVGQ